MCKGVKSTSISIIFICKKMSNQKKRCCDVCAVAFVLGDFVTGEEFEVEISNVREIQLFKIFESGGAQLIIRCELGKYMGYHDSTFDVHDICPECYKTVRLTKKFDLQCLRCDSVVPSKFTDDFENHISKLYDGTSCVPMTRNSDGIYYTTHFVGIQLKKMFG
jgi:hypothetical protein